MVYVVDSSREPAFLSSDFRDSFTARMMLPTFTPAPRASAQFLSAPEPQPGTSSGYQGLSDSNQFDAQWSFRYPPSHVRHKPVFAHQQPRDLHQSFHNPIGQYPHHGQGPFHHRIHRHDAAVVMNADVTQASHTTSSRDPDQVMKKRRSSHFGTDTTRVKKSPDVDTHPRCRRERVRRAGVTCRYSPRLSPSLRYVNEPMVAADSTNSYLFPPPPCPVDLSSGSDCDSDIDVINPLLYPCVSNRPARPQPFMPLVGEEDLHSYTNSEMPSTNRDFESHVLDYGNGCPGQSDMQFVQPSSVSQPDETVIRGDMSASPQLHVIFDRNDDTDSDVEVVSVVTR